MSQDELLYFRLYNRLLDCEQEMASVLEGNQAGPGDVGSRVLRVMKSLKGVVCGMND